MSDNTLFAFVAALICVSFAMLLWVLSMETVVKAGKCGTPLHIEACK